MFANWLGREDSNLRMPDPKTGALPLGYAPLLISRNLLGNGPMYNRLSSLSTGRLKSAVHLLAVFFPRDRRYGKLSPGDLIVKGF